MKSFFEEYGFTILASIVVILLITMTTPIGTVVKNNISNIIDSFSDKTSQKLDATSKINLYSKDVIKIDGKRYIVIKHIEENVYLLMAPKLDEMVLFNKCEELGEDNQCIKSSNVYQSSDIANYLDREYYNSLPFRSAIVSQTINQKVYTDEDFIKNENYKNVAIEGQAGFYIFDGSHASIKEAGTHKVFLPSVDEFKEIINVNDSKQMGEFLKSDDPTNKYRFWMRDILNTNKSPYNFNVLNAGPASRSMHYCLSTTDEVSVSPVFAVDLTNVLFEEIK